MRASCATATGRHQQRISLTDRLLAKKAVTARPADDDQSYVTSWIASLSFKASSSAHSGCSCCACCRRWYASSTPPPGPRSAGPASRRYKGRHESDLSLTLPTFFLSFHRRRSGSIPGDRSAAYGAQRRVSNRNFLMVLFLSLSIYAR